MISKGRKKGTVRFSLKPRTKAKSVAVAGDFTGWKPQAMKKQKSGEFVATLEVPVGTYEYKFLVDEEWVTDPDNSTWSRNPFGTMNSVAIVE